MSKAMYREKTQQKLTDADTVEMFLNKFVKNHIEAGSGIRDGEQCSLNSLWFSLTIQELRTA